MTIEQMFIKAYKNAIRFTEDFDARLEFSPKVEADIEKNCKAFITKAGDLILADPAQAGHDFWLTRNRHGSGFWDGDWPEDARKTLTDLAHSFGEKFYIAGDTGLIEL